MQLKNNYQLIFFLLLLTCVQVHGQSRIGLRAGMNCIYTSASGIAGTNSIGLPYSYMMSPSLGLNLNFEISENLDLISGLDWNTRGYKEQSRQDKFMIRYITVPFMLKGTIRRSLFGTIGGEYSMPVSEVIITSRKELRTDASDRPDDLGLSYGLGIEFSPGLEIGLRQSIGLTSYKGSIGIDGNGESVQAFDTYHRSILFELRIYLFSLSGSK